MDLKLDRKIKIAALQTFFEEDTDLSKLFTRRLAAYVYDNWELLDRVIAGKVENLSEEVRYVECE
ncbi:hypothetical protein [Peptoniphilus sp. EMRHCC_23]|uniref:hypothetical protein n=1 Tax=Peptoniphilus rachelemmaiella TaxID=2811779 RepID=UPI001C003BB1|nr:hypothetical protein [Peptoniphilus rachelemmaiella]